MPSLIQELLAEGPVLTDGAWGTELQARGLPPGACPDLWNLEAPDRVEEVARAYVDAGSRIILTNTFGANRFVLEGRGMADEAAEIARRGARISRSAAGDRAFVFGSIGPSGKMLLAGDVEPGDLREAFAEQALALAEGGADALVVETMADLDEALLALEGARRTGLPVVACLVFDSGRDLDRTMMGTTPEQAAAA
ncbi:MAG: homocysteine S-methyltransferase family protein, partial [Pirellulales bacterium]|nr:homocysteine S-methyltransferase family protein [Pirellulales bacterium]